MIPLIIAGVAGAAVGAAVKSAFSEPEVVVKTVVREKERLLDNEVPDDVNRQVEGSARQSQISSQSSSGNFKYTRNAQALYQAANEYLYGWNGRSINKNKAFELYQSAAEAGHHAAQVQQKNIWGLDDSTRQRGKTAEEIYQKAHDYYYGRNGCRKDISKAIELYSKAADMGHNGARVNLKNFGIYR